MNAIKLTIRGIPVEVSTPADAFELIRLAEASESASHPASAPANGRRAPAPQHAQSKQQTADPQALRLAAEFLRAIQSGGAIGVGTDRIMGALKVTHGKAVGSRLAHINRIIESTGFPIREVYSNKKSSEGRVWKPRKSLDAAIASIDQSLNANL